MNGQTNSSFCGRLVGESNNILAYKIINEASNEQKWFSLGTNELEFGERIIDLTGYSLMRDQKRKIKLWDCRHSTAKRFVNGQIRVEDFGNGQFDYLFDRFRSPESMDRYVSMLACNISINEN
jgi:hypothetical protein